MQYALAVDGGGSKTDAVVMDKTGQVLGWGRGGPVHCYYSTPEEVNQAYRQALVEALGQIKAEGFCLAGLEPEHPACAVVAPHGPIIGHVLSGEVETAFASVQEEWGLVVLAGTGSFVSGVTPEGQRRHFGSLGPILDDYGSGYQIGLLGLRAAFASSWTSTRRTTLQSHVPSVYALPNLQAVFDKTYGPGGLSRREVAAVARVVNEQAELGDQVAIRCLRRAADELADVALDVIGELEMHHLDFPLIAVGSVAQKSRLWWERMCERVQAVAPCVRPVIPRVRPVIGGALLALKALGVPWTPELLERILETQVPFVEAVERR